MTLCVTDVQRLIVEAGGDVRPGTPLKLYFWTVCQKLKLVGVDVGPRTLERAWREQVLSERVRCALEEVARKRAFSDGHRLLRYVEAIVDKAEAEFDPDLVRDHVPNVRKSLHWIRALLAAFHDQAVVEGCLHLAGAAEREAAEPGAD